MLGAAKVVLPECFAQLPTHTRKIVASDARTRVK